jgi:hypothetical protein
VPEKLKIGLARRLYFPMTLLLRYAHTPIPAPPITTATMAAHRMIGGEASDGVVGVDVGVMINVDVIASVGVMVRVGATMGV